MCFLALFITARQVAFHSSPADIFGRHRACLEAPCDSHGLLPQAETVWPVAARMAGSTLDISAALTSTRSSREFSRASIEKIRASFDKLRPTPALQRSDLYTPSSLSQEIAPAALKAACSPHPPSLLQSLKARCAQARIWRTRWPLSQPELRQSGGCCVRVNTTRQTRICSSHTPPDTDLLRAGILRHTLHKT